MIYLAYNPRSLLDSHKLIWPFFHHLLLSGPIPWTNKFFNQNISAMVTIFSDTTKFTSKVCAYENLIKTPNKSNMPYSGSNWLWFFNQEILDKGILWSEHHLPYLSQGARKTVLYLINFLSRAHVYDSCTCVHAKIFTGGKKNWCSPPTFWV